MINKKNYQHYILSKFNLPRGRSRRKPSKEWIKVYYKLFDTYCYPSVYQQTHKNFHWLIAFDETTINKKWVESHKKIIPLYINNFSKSYRHYFKEYITSHYTPEVEYLITTRFDVDDSLHEDFIKTVHINIRSCDSDNLVVSLVHGLTRNTKTRKMRRWIRDYANPFITLMEKLDDSNDIKTVRCRKHVQIMKGNNFDLLYVYTKKPMWIQNIHGRNVSNTMRGRPANTDLTPYHMKEK